MTEYIKGLIQIIKWSYQYPFSMTFELLKIPRGFLNRPQYWWLFAIQTDTSDTYLILSILGNNFEWKKKLTNPTQG